MNIMREYEIKNTSIKNVKSGTAYKKNLVYLHCREVNSKQKYR